MRWKRLDAPGEEEATLFPWKSTWHLRGSLRTVFAGSSASIRYAIGCRGWTFSFAAISMRWRGTRRRLVAFRDLDGAWRVSRRLHPDLSRCEDIDLSVTPSTNTIPIRRLRLRIGERADVTAAWVRFPELTVSPLAQRYTRLGENLYRYENPASGFAAELETDDLGLVVRYPGLWERI